MKKFLLTILLSGMTCAAVAQSDVAWYLLKSYPQVSMAPLPLLAVDANGSFTNAYEGPWEWWLVLPDFVHWPSSTSYYFSNYMGGIDAAQVSPGTTNGYVGGVWSGIAGYFPGISATGWVAFKVSFLVMYSNQNSFFVQKEAIIDPGYSYADWYFQGNIYTNSQSGYLALARYDQYSPALPAWMPDPYQQPAIVWEPDPVTLQPTARFHLWQAGANRSVNWQMSVDALGTWTPQPPTKNDPYGNWQGNVPGFIQSPGKVGWFKAETSLWP
jgi:hypothetical protein